MGGFEAGGNTACFGKGKLGRAPARGCSRRHLPPARLQRVEDMSRAGCAGPRPFPAGERPKLLAPHTATPHRTHTRRRGPRRRTSGAPGKVFCSSCIVERAAFCHRSMPFSMRAKVGMRAFWLRLRRCVPMSQRLDCSTTMSGSRGFRQPRRALLRLPLGLGEEGMPLGARGAGRSAPMLVAPQASGRVQTVLWPDSWPDRPSAAEQAPAAPAQALEPPAPRPPGQDTKERARARLPPTAGLWLT